MQDHGFAVYIFLLCVFASIVSGQYTHTIDPARIPPQQYPVVTVPSNEILKPRPTNGEPATITGTPVDSHNRAAETQNFKPGECWPPIPHCEEMCDPQGCRYYVDVSNSFLVRLEDFSLNYCRKHTFSTTHLPNKIPAALGRLSSTFSRLRKRLQLYRTCYTFCHPYRS